jgi:hypothetical protein
LAVRVLSEVNETLSSDENDFTIVMFEVAHLPKKFFSLAL